MRSLLNLLNKKEKLKILTCPTHERYQSNLSEVDADFYLFRHGQHIKDWNFNYSDLPENHYLMPEGYFPNGIDFDIVLSQSRFCQYDILARISKDIQVPLLNLEHTLPLRQWSLDQFNYIKNMRGDINVYISEFSAKMWQEPNPYIIRHCVDIDVFHPENERKNHILTVVNDYAGRDDVLNFSQYLRVTEGLPTFPVGDTPGLSESAKNVEELANFYSSSKIFLNTSCWSPIPSSLLEAMASGCACVSSKNCEIPYYIEHGVNGLLASNDEEMRKYLILLLENDDLAYTLGENARTTMINKCSKEVFTKNWNNLFKNVINSQLRIKNEN